jgi:hypothetical protein
MDFCILSPVQGLKRYASLSKSHLCLAHLTNPGYWEFYQGININDHLILDNGGYEGKPNTKLILERIEQVSPDVVVLPDYLGEEWRKTVQASMQFLDSYYYEFRCKWMFVPQSKPGDIMGFIDGLYTALEDERISWIGLPRALCYSITNDLSMRVRMAEQIRKRSSRVKIHALGMVKGNVAELNALRESGCVTSIDSNAPVWRGWNMHHLHEEWGEKPTNYDNTDIPEPGSLRDEIILDNLEAVGVKCRPTR